MGGLLGGGDWMGGVEGMVGVEGRGGCWGWRVRGCGCGEGEVGMREGGVAGGGGVEMDGLGVEYRWVE